MNSPHSAPLADSGREQLTQRPEPEAIIEQRLQCWQRALQLGLPTTQQEAWRFTDVTALAALDLRPTASHVSVQAAELAAEYLPTLPHVGCQLIFINGHFIPTLSSVLALPEGVIVTSLQQAIHPHLELIQQHLNQLPGLADHPFSMRNSACWDDGTLIYVPQGVTLEAPIHLVYWTTAATAVKDTLQVNYPRNLLILEDDANATVVEEYGSDGSAVTLPVTEIRLHAGSRLNYHKVQHDVESSWHLAALRVHQFAYSYFYGHLFNDGAKLARTDSFVLLDGTKATCRLNGLTVLTGQQTADYHLRIDHAHPETHSEQLFKAVLSDQSQAVFDGLIHVQPHAIRSEAHQINRNLLLSKQSRVQSNPRLEILTDDVQCSHGSSTGFLDADALFYLQSRGIPPNQAQSFLVQAFVGELIERIEFSALRERLAARLFAQPAM